MTQFAMKKGKDRRGSVGNLEELVKKKRKEPMLEKGDEELLRSRKKSGVIKFAELGWIEGEGKLQQSMKSWKLEIEKIMNEMRGIKVLREEIRNMKEEVKEGIREQEIRVSEEIEKIRKEFRQSEKRWKEERDELKKRIEELKGKIEKTENRFFREKEGSRAVTRGAKEGIGIKIKELESRMERREREERRKNVLIKGVEIKEGRRKVAVEELLGSIGVKAEIEEVRKIGGDGKGGRQMIIVRLKNEEQRMEVWNKKKFLKGRKERILEDWTWKKRRMRWSLERIAREEEKKGRKVWIGYGKIRIDEK
ncbi:hypothetical protein ACFW04_014384 [Cataglyphis niger]